MTQEQKVKIVVKALRKKFPSLSAIEATYAAYTIIEALEKAETKDESA